MKIAAAFFHLQHELRVEQSAALLALTRERAPPQLNFHLDRLHRARSETFDQGGQGLLNIWADGGFGAGA